MKEGIHPEYYETKVKCGGCGTEFVVGSVLKEMQIGVCSKCHPFYTGKARVLDSEGRVDQFERKYSKFLKNKKESQNKQSDESASDSK